jgi:toxin ParE1/3/4
VTVRLLVTSETAERDLDEASAHYLREGGERLAFKFVDAIDRAYDHVWRHPATGSSHYAIELRMPGLRFWRVNRFPYLVLYAESSERIDVWRVLHCRRDIPAWMQVVDTL